MASSLEPPLAVYRLGAMRVIAVIIAVVLFTTACSRSSHRAAQHPTASSTAPSAVDAGELCRTALRGRTVLNSLGTNVGEVRAVRVGPGGRPGAGAFTTSGESEPAAWCWLGKPRSYTLYGVGPHGESVRIEGLAG